MNAQQPPAGVTRIPDKVWVAVLTELLKTPGVSLVKLIQMPVIPTISLPGQPASYTFGEPEIQVFRPDEFGKGVPVNILQGNMAVAYEVHGRFPTFPIIPSPGAMTGFMAEKVRQNPMPITLAWTQCNFATGDYIAVSQGGPMMEIIDVDKPEKGLIKGKLN